MCRELHEGYMPERVRHRNQKNSRLNHFFIHRIIHSALHFVAAWKSRVPVFPNAIARGKCGAPCVLWRTLAIE